MNLPLCAIPALLVVAASSAQEAAPPANAPRELLRLEADGPAALRTKFAPTNLGAMLASQEGSALWRPRVAPFDVGLRRLLAGKDDAPVGGPALDRWLGYAGRIEFVLWVRNPERDGEQPQPFAALRVHGDGRSDLDAMATDLRNVLQASAESRFVERREGVRAWQVARLGTRFVTSPARAGDTVVALFGDVENLAMAEAVAATMPRPSAKAAPLRLLLRAQDVDLQLADFDHAVAQGWRSLGLPSLHSLEFSARAVGPHVQLEAAAEFRGEERGLFAGLFPAVSALPRLMHLAPDDGTPWKVGHFDWSAWVRTLGRAADAAPVEPEADWAAHLHTDCLLLGSPGWSARHGFDLDACFAWRTRDETKFAAAFAAMCRTQRVLERTGQTEHDGITITSYTRFVPLEVAIARGLFVVACGDNARRRVVEVLDRARAAASDEPPAAWQELLRHAPAGRNGLGEVDVVRALTHQVSLLSAVVAFLPGRFADLVPDSDFDAVGKEIAPLLERHDLRRLRTITGHHDGRWAFRIFW